MVLFFCNGKATKTMPLVTVVHNVENVPEPERPYLRTFLDGIPTRSSESAPKNAVLFAERPSLGQFSHHPSVTSTLLWRREAHSLATALTTGDKTLPYPSSFSSIKATAVAISRGVFFPDGRPDGPGAGTFSQTHPGRYGGDPIGSGAISVAQVVSGNPHSGFHGGRGGRGFGRGGRGSKSGPLGQRGGRGRGAAMARGPVEPSGSADWLSQERLEKARDAEARTDVVVSTDAGTLVVINAASAPEGDYWLETKGVCITALLTAKMTAHTISDMIVGDSEGTVYIISRLRVVFRCCTGAAITCLAVHTSSEHGPLVIAGDAKGSLTALSLTDRKWRAQVGGTRPTETLGYSPGIRCILPTKVVNAKGEVGEFILACDGSRRIIFMRQGYIAFWVTTPSAVKAICTGFFWQLNVTGNARIGASLPSQVLLAGDDANLYILDTFKLYRYASVDFAITHVESLRPKDADPACADLVLCIGHHASVRIFREGELLHSIETPDWPYRLVVGDPIAGGHPLVVLSFCDGAVEAHSISVDRESADDRRSAIIQAPRAQRRVRSACLTGCGCCVRCQ
ncbi:hypothetical protein DFJ73DRAFT_206000 [Zopfochytrium polystomum]|nr:hypothetical protein DFJ73DRAFT_206000 [Zopfochytrium polystomum]